jgi:two-component system cell cycle sensor histidine kinase/response regulator CckA
LADDDEVVRKLTRTVLERAGYTVLEAQDGEEALRVFEEHGEEVGLFLLDVVMPKLSGRGVYEQLSALRSDLRFLFASGYSMNAIHTNFVLDDGLILIQKPYSQDELLRKVRAILDGESAAD